MTDTEMIAIALWYHARDRNRFANAIAQKTYRNRAGRKPSSRDVHDALDAAEQADRLVGEWREKRDAH